MSAIFNQFEILTDYSIRIGAFSFFFPRTRVVARVAGGVEISQNETQMAQWLLQNGPISVGINFVLLLL